MNIYDYRSHKREDNKNNYKNKYQVSACVHNRTESRLEPESKPRKLIILYCKDICFYGQLFAEESEY